ncbi:hypothetical protein ACFX5Q_19670 [Mesorhizobium sp. IMUNJ 23033]|uniref:hypothetical protein n=1 Tax=Mesorhizobium sp. IMUNJ 23033 TaxID=3378039 RepID=UPI0038503F67
MVAGVPMTIRSVLCPIACGIAMANATLAMAIAALAMASATPAFAAPECLANGKSFQVGQVACLTLGEKSHLARCEMVLNNTSWTKIHDDCPATKPPLHPTSISTPAPSMVPAEPTEN